MYGLLLGIRTVCAYLQLRENIFLWCDRLLIQNRIQPSSVWKIQGGSDEIVQKSDGVFSSSEIGSRTEKIFRLKTIVISSSSLIIINQEETLEQDSPNHSLETKCLYYYTRKCLF